MVCHLVWILHGAIPLTTEIDPTIFSVQHGKEKLEPTGQAAEPLATCTCYLIWVLSLSCSGIRVIWSSVNLNDCMKTLRLKNLRLKNQDCWERWATDDPTQDLN